MGSTGLKVTNREMRLLKKSKKYGVVSKKRCYDYVLHILFRNELSRTLYLPSCSKVVPILFLR